MAFVEKIKEFPDFIGSNGRSTSEITNCEKQLGLKFADDYADYLQKIGLACFDGHELTGICDSPRLNVIKVTQEAKKNNPQAPDDCYVIEDPYIDGIVIWQSKSGEIFQTMPNQKPVKIFNSLLEYVEEE